MKAPAWWRMTGSARMILTRGLESVEHLSSGGTWGMGMKETFVENMFTVGCLVMARLEG